MSLYKRIERVLELRSLTPYDLSKRAGLSTSQVRQWIDRKSERVSAEVLQRVAAAAGVNERWLLTGEGDPLDPTSERPEGDAPPSNNYPPGCVGASPTYQPNKKTARRLAPDVPEDWVWDDLGTVDTLFLGTREPTPAVLADLARLIQKHGKPR